MIGYSSTKPLLVFGTRHGCIYNLTPHHLPNLPAISLSLGDFYDNRQTIKSLPNNLSLKKFIGFPENTITYLAPYDFYKEDCMAGCQDSKIIKIKCSKGYTPFTADLYDQMVELIKPQIYVAMTEYPSTEKQHKQDSNKSYKRAILKTKTYYQNSKLSKQNKNRPFLLGPLHGGKNLSLLARSLQDNLSNNVDGLVLCDVCSNETLEEREVVYNFILERLKQQQKTYSLGLAGQGKLQDIKHAIKFGFSIFQVNYPFTLAQKHLALVYNNDKDMYQVREPKKTQLLTPLSQNCNCYSCKTHNQSYIAHLVECFEMNAKILLTIHNIEIYCKFMKTFDK